MAWKVAPVAYAATAAGRPAVSMRRRTRAMRVHTTQIANEIVVTYGLIGIEPPKEKIIDEGTAKLARRQADAMHHQQGDIARDVPLVVVR